MFIVWQRINKNEWRLNAKNADKTKALKAYAGCVKSVGVNKCRLTEDIKPKLDIKATVEEEEVDTSEKPNKFIRTRNYGVPCKNSGQGTVLTKLGHGAWVPRVSGGSADGEIWKKMDSDGYIVIRVFEKEKPEGKPTIMRFEGDGIKLDNGDWIRVTQDFDPELRDFRIGTPLQYDGGRKKWEIWDGKGLPGGKIEEIGEHPERLKIVVHRYRDKTPAVPE